MIINAWQKQERIPLSNVFITVNKQPIERVSHITFLGAIDRVRGREIERKRWREY